jgi:hypothetical protein
MEVLTGVRAVDPRGMEVGPGHKDFEYCQSLLKRMENLRKKIVDREAELTANPRSLPEYVPGMSRYHRAGHRALINRDWNQLRKLEDEYDQRCGGGCPPGSESSSGVPVTSVLGALGRLAAGRSGGGMGKVAPIAPGIGLVLN